PAAAPAAPPKGEAATGGELRASGKSWDKTMEFRAEMRYLRVSPQKARLVLDLIKGRKVEEARNTLLYTKKRVAAHVGKLLQSALDNANFLSAEKNLDVELDNLYVKNAIANQRRRNE